MIATAECYSCSYFLKEPDKIGGKAYCKYFSNGIPKRIFVEGGNCVKKPKKGVLKKSGVRKSKK